MHPSIENLFRPLNAIYSYCIASANMRRIVYPRTQLFWPMKTQHLATVGSVGRSEYDFEVIYVGVFKGFQHSSFIIKNCYSPMLQSWKRDIAMKIAALAAPIGDVKRSTHMATSSVIEYLSGHVKSVYCILSDILNKSLDIVLMYSIQYFVKIIHGSVLPSA